VISNVLHIWSLPSIISRRRESRFQFLGVLIDVEELDNKKDIIRKEIIDALKMSCGFGFAKREIQFRVLATDRRCVKHQPTTIDVRF
jgi:hypothetical protein